MNKYKIEYIIIIISSMLNINNIKKEIYDKYYNKEKFKKANDKFELFLSNCNIITKEMSFTEFNISTITVILKISDSFNIKVLYEQLKINNKIIYLEYNEKIKGKRNKKKVKNKKTTDKRMEKRGKCFSNQLSIGFHCDQNYHKKPICLKVFSKGSMTLTGVKSDSEINYIIKEYSNMIRNIKTEYLFNDKIIILKPYENLYNLKDIKNNIETINGSFKCNFNINLKNMKKLLTNNYKEGEIYIKNNRSALIELDLLFYNIYDKRKNKNKTPKISIYGTGSIVINSVNKEVLYKSYEFIKKLIIDNYSKIIDIDYNFNL